MASARTIKTRNGKYYKSNAESNIRPARKQYKTTPERKRRAARKQYKTSPERKRRTARKQFRIIQSPKGKPLISNNYYYSSNSESSNIIIILGETRLSHSLAKPDCYARNNSPCTYRPPYFRGNSERNVQLQLSKLLLRA